MKTMKNLCLAMLALSLLTTPALRPLTGVAQQGGSHVPIRFRPRTRRPTRTRTPPRAARAKKTRTREGWEKNAKHKAKGHSKLEQRLDQTGRGSCQKCRWLPTADAGVMAVQEYLRVIEPQETLGVVVCGIVGVALIVLVPTNPARDLAAAGS